MQNFFCVCSSQLDTFVRKRQNLMYAVQLRRRTTPGKLRQDRHSAASKLHKHTHCLRAQNENMSTSLSGRCLSKK